MRKLTLTLVFLFAAAVPLFAAPRCRPEWTRFNCAVYQLGVDEGKAYAAGGMSWAQYDELAAVHSNIFWTAKSLEQNEHSHDMQTLGPKLENYRGEVRALLLLRVISKSAAARLINDSVEWEASMNAPRAWFGDPEAVWRAEDWR